jgi:DnaJ-domain-containing protein 1
MNLPGRLKFTTLGDLLGTLHRAGATGVLEIVEASGVNAGRCHRVKLRAGLVDAVETDLEHPRLGELLAREGALDRQGLSTLLRRMVEEPERRSGEILVDERLASAALVEAALRWQLRMRIDAVFRLPDGLVRFHVRRSEARPGLRSLLTPRDFLHGRRRARSESRSSAAAQAHGDVRRAEAYRLLGVELGADSATVRRAFRKLASEHHPDRHPGATADQLSALVRTFSRITAAYHSIER